MKQKIIVIDNFLDSPLDYKKSKQYLTEEISYKLKHILLSDVNITSVESNNPPTEITANFAVDYIAMIYLDLPTECVDKKGIGFWLHKETQDEEIPNHTKMKWMGLKTPEEVESSYDVSNKNLWDKYMEYFVKYNRIVLFDANLFHSYGDKSDCRKFFVRINNQ